MADVPTALDRAAKILRALHDSAEVEIRIGMTARATYPNGGGWADGGHLLTLRAGDPFTDAELALAIQRMAIEAAPKLAASMARMEQVEAARADRAVAEAEADAAEGRDG